MQRKRMTRRKTVKEEMELVVLAAAMDHHSPDDSFNQHTR